MVGLRKQAALILTIIAIVALTVTLNIGDVHALPPTLILTPNPVTQGANVVVTGIDFSPGNGFVYAFTDNTGSCSDPVFFAGATSADASGNLGPVTIPTTGVSVGTHCVMTVGFVVVGTLFPYNAAASLTVNQAPPIPEYPYGLPLLAIFMVITYGVIRRKTKHET